MSSTLSQDEKIAKLIFANVYPLYVNKIIKKKRTIEELQQVIFWLTSYNQKDLEFHLNNKSNFEVFFENASINPKISLIKGLICGYRVEEINNPLTQKIRYLDKLVDELAKGKKLEKIFRE